MNKKLIRKMLTAARGNLFSDKKDHSSRMITTGGAGYIPPHTQLDKTTIRQNLYDNLSPHSYQSLSDAFKSILGTNTGATHTLEDVSVNSYAEQPIDDAIWATYLGIPKSKRHKKSPELVRSKYTPSMGKDDVTYYKFPLIDGINYVVEEGTRLPIGSNKLTNMDSSSARVGNVGDYTIGHGYDNQGEYVSMYDKWDINPFKGSYRMTGLLGDIGNSLFGNIDDLSFGIGKPVHLYDRIYLDDYYGVKEPTHATYLPEIIVTGKKKQGGKMNVLEFLKNGNKIKKALWGTNLDVDNRSDTTRQGSGTMPDSAYGAADAPNTGGLLSLLDTFNTVKDAGPRNVTLSNGKQITIPGVLTGTPTFLPTFGPGLLLQGRLVNYVMNPAEKAARADFLKSADEIKTLAGSGHIPKGVQGDWMYPTEILKKYKLKQFSTPVKQEASNLLKITKLSETSSAKKTSSLRFKEYYSKKKEDRNNGVSKVRSRLVLNNKAQTTGDMRAANTGRPRRAARYTDLKTELEKDKGFWGKQYNIIRRKIALGKQGAESKEKEFLESYWNYKQKGILNKEKFGGTLFKKGGIIKAEDGTKLTEEQKKISWGKLVYPEIVSALDAIGVNREYAPYVFAMSANESGWGLNPSGQNNYFGMKAGKNQKGTVVTTHEGYGNNRVKIRDKFLDYSSLSDSINQAVRRLNDKFNAFSVPVELFVMNLYQNRYYTNSPANYHDTVNGIVNGKLIKKVLNETKLPDYRMPLVLDWNSTPQWTMKNLY